MKVNLNQELNKETVQLILEEYKVYLAPLAAVIGAILLFLFILLPQILSLSAKRNAANNENQKLNNIVTAKNIASSTDLTQLASDLTIANAVLPSSKDFQGVIGAITTAGAETNIGIQSYQFQDVASGAQNGLSSYPSVTFTMTLLGSPQQVMDFINKLYEKAPLVEVETITGTQTSSSVLASFFYKPFSPVDPSAIQVKKMNGAQTNALNTVSKWDITTFELGNLPESTGSAQEDNSPF